MGGLSFDVRQGDALDVLRTLPDASVRCCVTSPPYWGLRDYGIDGQLGLERTPEEYVARIVEVFREVRRVLADDGTLWLNLGDSYAAGIKGSGGVGKGTLNCGPRLNAISTRRQMTGTRHYESGLKPKDLVGIPWRVAFALQADGWWLRSDIIWSKPNPMPESVTDRPTKAHEYLFLLSKSERYYYDAAEICEVATHARKVGKSLSRGQANGANVAASGNGRADSVVVSDTRNRRTVWTIPTQPFPEAHFAVMPEALVEPCILAGSAPGDLVLDPFTGSGTVGVVALRHGRRFVGAELNPSYVEMARRRVRGPLFTKVQDEHADSKTSQARP